MSNEIAKNVIEALESNPQVQMTIATGTTWTALDFGFIQYLQPLLAFIIAVLGGVLTTILIVRNVRGMNRENKEYKHKLKNRDK